MKRRSLLISGVLCICLLFTSVQAAFASSIASNENGAYRPTIYINGEKQDLKGVIPPSGSTLVPFREFFSVLNIEPTFNNKTKTLTVKNDETTITLTVGKRVATLNGKEVQLLQAPKIEDGITYVNLRFIAESFGGTVRFDKSSLKIYIDFQSITDLTTIWANALKTRDGKPRYEMMSEQAKEKFKREQINKSGENWNYIIGVSSPWVVDFKFEINGMNATITYRTRTSEPAYYNTKETITFVKKNGKLFVEDYQTIFEDQLIETN
ncbi:copper amine oxidase N-terminal domain-containing protein [Peribacillus loiseleuriae]|uniref:copper amine oxidase N-terminal domain-containing protein n=1 Tax=Peribacillus loiseleuriae TaxID=1679170 RepID=UPI003826E029